MIIINLKGEFIPTPRKIKLRLRIRKERERERERERMNEEISKLKTLYT